MGSYVINIAESSGLAAIAENSERLVLHELIHKNTDDVPVAVTYVLIFSIDVVRSEYDIVEAEHFMSRLQVQLYGVLGHAIGVLGNRHSVFSQWHLARPVNSNA